MTPTPPESRPWRTSPSSPSDRPPGVQSPCPVRPPPPPITRYPPRPLNPDPCCRHSPTRGTTANAAVPAPDPPQATKALSRTAPAVAAPRRHVSHPNRVRGPDRGHAPAPPEAWRGQTSFSAPPTVPSPPQQLPGPGTTTLAPPVAPAPPLRPGLTPTHAESVHSGARPPSPSWPSDIPVPLQRASSARPHRRRLPPDCP